VVFFDQQGVPFAAPADPPMIQAAPDPRDGTWHYSIAASVAEGLGIDSGGGALNGIVSAVRGMFGPTAATGASDGGCQIDALHNASLMGARVL